MYEKFDVEEPKKRKYPIVKILFGIGIITNIILTSVGIWLNYTFLYSPILQYRDKMTTFMVEIDSLSSFENRIDSFINITTPVVINLRNFMCQMYPKDCP